MSWVTCATEGSDLHAGRTETSLMLHLKPWEVRLERAEPGNRESLEELLPHMVEGGVKAVAPNGVLGDPRAATTSEGREVLDEMAWLVSRDVLHLVEVVAL